MSNYTVVSRNINFLRFKYGTHEELAERLKSLVSWTQLSDYARAKAQPSSAAKEQIEAQLGLPVGWLDRDNLSLVDLSTRDHVLVSAVLALRPEVRKALLALIDVLDADSAKPSD